MSTDLATRPQQEMSASWMFDQSAVSQIQRVANMFCNSTLVPKDYQGDKGLPNCVIALNMAYRMKADPLMVMQNLYVVHGRPSWSSQFMIACFNQTGRFSPIRYVWTGVEGEDNWGCQAWSTDKESGERIEGPTITIAMAKKEGWYAKSGSKWQSIPKLMLMYRAASWMVRTHAPELTMGLQTAEESSDAGPEPATISTASRMDTIAAVLSPPKSSVIETTYVDPVSEFAPGETEEPAKYVTRIRKAISISTSVESLSELIGTVESYAGGEFLDSPTFEKLQALAVTRLKEIEDAKASGKLL